MPAKYENIEITEEFLNSNPNAFFIFGDNLKGVGTGGAAKLRHHPRAIGFATKKAPDNEVGSSFKPEEYSKIFFKLLGQLSDLIKRNPANTYYVSRLGAGLANKYLIWQLIIKHNLIEELADCDNVVFCWNEHE